MFDVIVRDLLDPRFGIRRGDRVLDIGCGGLPYPFATHLADLSLTDHSDRFGLAVPLGDRPVFECSVEQMPFDDYEFDFVYCAHVLEHTENPEAACRELMRVGRRGYIECPRSWAEYVFSAPAHRWLVDLECGVLVFREKVPAEEGNPLGLRWSIFALLERPEFRNHWDSPEMYELRTVQLIWEDAFPFVVIRASERQVRAQRPPLVDETIRRHVTARVLDAFTGAAA
jgi:SAM-dependent methyltransferase